MSDFARVVPNLKAVEFGFPFLRERSAFLPDFAAGLRVPFEAEISG